MDRPTAKGRHSASHTTQTDRSLPIALLRAREKVMGPIREMLSQSGINEQKWRVLRVLDEGGPMEHSAIAEAACLLLPSLTRILKSMEAEGLLERAPGKTDRRKTVVTLTETGRQLILDHADASRDILARMEAALGSDKFEQLLDLLEELRHAKV